MLTLRTAYQDYLRGRGHELSPRSIGWMDQKLFGHLSDLLDIPLAEVTPRVCRERHEFLTRTSGKSSANGCLRIVKAVWNDAARVDDSLPENPVSRGVRLNRERPRDWALTLKELPGVWAAIDGTKNQGYRVAWTFLLLTGVRSHDCRSLRWQDIDDEGVATFRCPKGGVDRKFYLPLPNVLRAELSGLYQSSEYVFPTGSKTGYLSELRRTDQIPAPHAFRHSWRTLAVEAGLDLQTIMVAMNHSAPGATWMYLSRANLTGHLREAMEKVATLIVSYRGRSPNE